jgi:hypothetical protein
VLVLLRKQGLLLLHLLKLLQRNGTRSTARFCVSKLMLHVQLRSEVCR